jgi:hypothetical protein
MKGLACIVMAACVLGGCERAKQDMYDQPRYKTYAPSPLFEDGASARPPVAGTEPRARGAFVPASTSCDATWRRTRRRRSRIRSTWPC